MSFVDEMKSTPRKIEIPTEYICKCVDTMLDEAAKIFVEDLKCKIKEIVKTENLRRIERTELTSGGEIILGDFAFANVYNSYIVRDHQFDIKISKGVEITNYDENSEYKLPNLGYVSNYGNMCACHNSLMFKSFYNDDINVLYDGGRSLHIKMRLRYLLETIKTGVIFRRETTHCIPNELMRKFSSRVSQIALKDSITTEFEGSWSNYDGLHVKHHYIFQY